MKLILASFAAALSAVSTLALGAQPSMRFLSVPAAASEVGATDAPQWIQSRHGGALIVIVRQRAACGQRPEQPWMTVGPDRVDLGYRMALAAPAAAGADCVARGIFSIRGLADRDLQVAAHSATTALVPTPEPAAPMSFLSLAAAPQSSAGRPGVLQIPGKERTVVIAKTAARCGARPSAPTLDSMCGSLRVGFDVVAPDADAGPACVVTAIFSIRHRPGETPDVVADARLKPAPIAPQTLPLAQPAMKFLSVPAVAQSEWMQPERLELRRGSQMIVILKQAAVCGQRPSQPWVDADANSVRVGYSVPTGGDGAAGPACVATGIFALRSVPAGKMDVAAGGGSGGARRCHAGHAVRPAQRHGGRDCSNAESIGPTLQGVDACVQLGCCACSW